MNDFFSIFAVALACVFASVSRVQAQADAEAARTDPEAAIAEAQADSYEDLLKLWGDTADSEATPIENLSVPLESHGNGRVKTLLTAKSALVPAEGVIRGKGVVVERRDENGVVDCIIAAENCIFDRETQRGFCQGDVSIYGRGVRVTGSNMVWNVENQSAKIIYKAKVVTNRFVKDMGKLLK